MARLTQAAVVFVGALCLVSLPTIVLSQEKPKFSVLGQVFCDVCRADFINRFSVPMPGAKVKLDCRSRGDGGEMEYSVEGETNTDGFYRLAAEGEWGEDLCEVKLVKSGRADCDEIPAEKPAADITLTAHNGFHGDVRYANPLSFNAKKALPRCVLLFKEIDDSKKENDH